MTSMTQTTDMAPTTHFVATLAQTPNIASELKDATSTLSFDWADIEDTRAKGSVIFSWDSPESYRFRGSVYPKPKDGKVSLKGELQS